MSMGPSYEPDGGPWRCGRCDRLVGQGKIQAFYLDSAFDVFLPRCPQCGLTMVPRTLAEGKMLEVESLLEDK